MKTLHVFVVCLMVLVLLGIQASPTNAAVPLVVNTAVDENDFSCADGDCSLRDAIALVGASNAYTIRFDSGLSGQTITLLSPLVIQKDLTIDGSTLASHIKLSGSNSHRVIQVNYDSASFTVTIKSVDIINGAGGSDDGGGIYNDGGTLTVQDVNFENNSATLGSGGAIYNESSHATPDLTVENSYFYQNSATFGGSIFMIGPMNVTDSEFEANTATWMGGTIYVNGTASITGSTIYDGSVAPTSSVGYDVIGGGIYVYGGTTTVTNSTIANNTATDFGGGVYVNNSSTLYLVNSTLSGNIATNDFGGNVYNHYATLHLMNTILANSPSGDGYDCYNEGGVITSNLNSLIEYNGPTTHTCGAPTQTADPQLTALSINAPGTTPVMAIPKTSPAFNTGSNSVCTAPVGSPSYGAGGVDQRGVPRPQGGTCDIGAFEIEIFGFTPGDYTGNGETNLAIRRGGKWYIQGVGNFGWGLPTDIPVPSDYDGDSMVEAAVYRDGKWFIKDIGTINYGIAGDIPVPADFDGDGTTDIAIRRGGKFYIMGIGNFGWGLPSDIPVPADYNGDGVAEIAVYRDGKWFIKDIGTINYGIAGDIPVPADYDGDGTTEIAIRRGGKFYIMGIGNYGWGIPTDVPVPGDYDGDGAAEIAVFRDGKWFIKDIGTINFGIAGDYPLPAPDTNADGDPYQ